MLTLNNKNTGTENPIFYKEIIATDFFDNDSNYSNYYNNLKILHVPENKFIKTTLGIINYKHIKNFTDFWLPHLKKFNQRDSNWNWKNTYDWIKKHPNYEGYAVEANSITQGLMLIQGNYHHPYLEPEERRVYINFLSTAPWNRAAIQSPPRYKGVGTTLLTLAAMRSVELGFKGRLGLHAVPESEEFYKKLSLKSYGKDCYNHNLTYFELSPEDAMINIMHVLLLNQLNEQF